MTTANIEPASSTIPFKRILLKLSGEMLAGVDKYGFNGTAIENICSQIVQIHKMGIRIAIVIGGGNIIRGVQQAQDEGMDRATADYMGMMGTIINGLALQDHLERSGVVTRLQTAIEIKTIAEPYIRRKALRHLEKQRVVILAGGTGNPFFTTDTTAALRAVELKTDIIFKATKVDGVYDDDPEKNPNAKKYKYVSFLEVLKKQLKVMDSTAFSLCMDNKMPIKIFNLNEDDILKRAVSGENLGTLIDWEQGAIYDE